MAAVAGLALFASATPAVAEGPELPGMCMGRSDAGMVLNAHANGTPKYVLNLETDAAGVPSGVLIIRRGAERLRIDRFCRMWQHLPGQEPGGGHEGGGHEGGGHEGGGAGEEGATIAHAVGLGQLADGTRILVRTDVRGVEEGTFFRVWYRPMGQHGGGEEPHAVAAEEPHEEESWVKLPAEGWLPLDMLKLRPAEG
jgi:hypothetical protein